ncbi:YcxB family protein [Joostella atrarenae]|uniref:YcxB family protein n=1 Tax=Joostella atrarenae TaxID=679257 RepID=A0ABS9J2C3_9FLAO|nr:YcxB family protein [Joostella atrarenae]MCF8714524.1 YcxB family protein [Joostella atrarenae]
MKLEFILEENDFLDYHLFSISDNKNSKKIEKIGKFVLAGLFLYFGLNLYNSDNIELAILFGVLAVLSILFFNKFYKSRMKKHQLKIIKSTYSKRIGEKETMEFTPDYLITEDKTGQGKTKLSEIECVNEIPNNFFIKLSNGSSFIVSKKGLANLDEFKKKWKALNIPIIEHLNWKWN